MWGVFLSNCHPKWAWAKPSTPVLWGYLPVAIAALLGLHPGLVAKALLIKIPSFARLSIVLVLTDYTP